MSAAPALSKRDERREAMLDVAQACFLEHGFAATSMSTIAARIGGSKGTLYNYFKNKEELFAAMMQRLCGDLQATLFDVEPEGGGAEARLTHFARAFLNHLMTPEAMGIQRLVVSEGGRFPQLGQVFYESGPVIVLSRIGDFLKDLMDAGRLRQTDPLVAAQHFKDLAISGIYWERIWGVTADPTPQQLDEQVARSVDTFLRAYAP
ncbi:MAG: TetR/AcrR family transcriptional regulator [Pseudomonadota bacterium]